MQLLRLIPLLPLALCLWAWPPTAMAGRPPLYALDEVVSLASRAFVGTCVDRRVEARPDGLVVTTYTFEVERTLKGDVASTAELSLLGSVEPEIPAPRLSIVPTWSVGDRRVLFLNGDSALGLTSTVGMHQGALAVIEGEGGPAVSVGPLLLRETAGMAYLTPAEWGMLRQGSVPLASFVVMVEALIAGAAR